MTCLANLNPNLVYASPDSPNTGYPDFRPLTANDVPALTLAPSVLTSNTGNVANLSANGVYFSPTFEIPANTLEAGSTFKVTVISDNLAPLSSNLAVKFGTSGTLSDANVYNVFLPGYAPVGVGETGNFVAEFLLSVRSNTAQLMTAMVTPIPITGTAGDSIEYSNTSQATQTTTINVAATNYIGTAFYNANTGFPTIGHCEFNLVVIEQVK